MKHTATKSRTPFADARAELQPKVAAVRNEYEALIAEQLRYEPDGVPPLNARITADEVAFAEAAVLLNGSGPDLSSRKNGSNGSYRALIKRRAVLERALDIAAQLDRELHIKERDELGQARKAEFDALLKQQALNLMAFERTAQALDDLARGTNLQSISLPRLGRLSNTASDLYTYLERAMKLGYITRRALDEEFTNARKAGE